MHLKSILESLDSISEKKTIIFPVHPRTMKKLSEYNLNTKVFKNILFIDPVGYLEMIFLLKNSSLVITDSGGLQKEAFFFNKLCVTLREETEWIELVKNGYNIIAGSDRDDILSCYDKMISKNIKFNMNLYGDGTASKKIVENILNEHPSN